MNKFSLLISSFFGLILQLGLSVLLYSLNPIHTFGLQSEIEKPFKKLFCHSIRWWHPNCPFLPSINVVQLQNLRLRNGYVHAAISKRENSNSIAQGTLEDTPVKKKRGRPKGSSAKTGKKTLSETPDKTSESILDADVTTEDAKKTQTRGRKKASTTSSALDEPQTEKKVTRRRKPKKKSEDTENQENDKEVSDQEGEFLIATMDGDDDEAKELMKDGDEEDISFTYGWPPLVCCFGAVQHAFVPAGRPANRLIDYEIHERMKDVLWAPEKFVRAPGGCASNVAVALSSLGGKVAFMGKLGDDDFGQSLLYYLNSNNVQTRSICIDSKRVTATSRMKLVKRGGLRTNYIKPSAEDSLSKSEINIDVLKEAKMFYFNTFSLLDRNMSSTTFQAIEISKKLGGLIFYDLNLPLPLWNSSEETKEFIKQAWDLADIIEITKQELEFLCGIEPYGRFDTKNNDKSKFVHYEPEVVAPLWHENLKVLIVTNGSSKIDYYTKEHNGFVRGTEDAPITPFTADMSATGDGIVAGLLRMLIVQPHLITDKGYLERTIKYAISCGVMDQWMQARKLGYPPKEGMEVTPDSNGIKAITEKQYRTLVPVS